MAVLSERKMDFDIISKSNLPRKQTRGKYCIMHLEDLIIYAATYYYFKKL